MRVRPSEPESDTIWSVEEERLRFHQEHSEPLMKTLRHNDALFEAPVNGAPDKVAGGSASAHG